MISMISGRICKRAEERRSRESPLRYAEIARDSAPSAESRARQYAQADYLAMICAMTTIGLSRD